MSNVKGSALMVQGLGERACTVGFQFSIQGIELVRISSSGFRAAQGLKLRAQG